MEVGWVDHGHHADPWSYWTVLKRQGRFAFLIFGMVVAGTILGTVYQSPRYRASGLLEIRRQGADVVPMDALFLERDLPRTYLETQQGLMRSYTLAVRVINDLSLDQVPEFWEPEPVPPAVPGVERSEAELQPVVEQFHEKLVVSPEAGGRLVRVQFAAKDPALASEVVNSILDNFVAMRIDGGEEATAWLSGQLDDTRETLESAELDLQRYAQENQLPLARGDEDVAANVQERLDALETDLMAARTERLAVEARHTTFVGEGRFESMESPVVDDLTERITELQREHALLTSTFSDAYPEVGRIARQISELEARREEERQRLGRNVTAEYRAALSRERLLEQAVAQEKVQSDSLMTRAASYRTLRREVEANEESYTTLRARLMDAEVSTAMLGVDVGIVDRAVPPPDPFWPSWPLSVAFGLLGGAVLAVSGAFAREYMSPTVRTAREVGVSVNAPVLAVIPSTTATAAPKGRPAIRGGSPAKGRIAPAAESEDAPSEIADALGGLRAAVVFDRGPESARSILVTSSIPGEGKTTISVNFAISLAEMGRDVLLVDADLRRPSVQRVLEMRPTAGLVQYLDGTEEEWPALVTRDHVPGLDVLVAGDEARAPESLLTSPRFATLLDEANELYDFVVIDGAALFIEAPDARIIASQVDGVVAVVRSGSTPRSVLRPVLSAVPNLLGVVLNDLDPADLPESYRSYARRHAQTDPREPVRTTADRATADRTTADRR